MAEFAPNPQQSIMDAGVAAGVNPFPYGTLEYFETEKAIITKYGVTPELAAIGYDPNATLTSFGIAKVPGIPAEIGYDKLPQYGTKYVAYQQARDAANQAVQQQLAQQVNLSILGTTNIGLSKGGLGETTSEKYGGAGVTPSGVPVSQIVEQSYKPITPQGGITDVGSQDWWSHEIFEREKAASQNVAGSPLAPESKQYQQFAAYASPVSYVGAGGPALDIFKEVKAQGGIVAPSVERMALRELLTPKQGSALQIGYQVSKQGAEQFFASTLPAPFTSAQQKRQQNEAMSAVPAPFGVDTILGAASDIWGDFYAGEQKKQERIMASDQYKFFTELTTTPFKLPGTGQKEAVSLAAAALFVPTILYGLGEGYQKNVVSPVSESAFTLAKGIPSIPGVPARELVNLGIGAGEMVASLPTFALSLPFAAAWTMARPAEAPMKAVDISVGMGTAMLEREAESPGSLAGSLIGMYIAPKVYAAGFRGVNYVSPISYGKVEIPTLKGDINTYRMVAAKAPWETWAASGRPVATLATGEVGTQFGLGRTGLQRIMGETTALVDLSEGLRLPSLPPEGQSAMAKDVYVKSMLETGKVASPEFVEMYQSYQKLQEGLQSPIGRATYQPQQAELFGELPTTGASAETMAKIFKASEGKPIVFTGSRANIRIFAGESARMADGFGGTMADFDIVMPQALMPKIGRTYAEIIKQERPLMKFTNYPEHVTIETTPKEFLNLQSAEKFTAQPRAGFFGGAYEVEAIGGSRVVVAGPLYALEAKMAGAFRGGKVRFTGERGIEFIEGKEMRAKDFPDLTSVSRSIARDLYSPVSLDVGEVFQSRKTGIAQSAEQLSDLSKQYALKNYGKDVAPKYAEFAGDILKGVERSPQPRVSISPESLALGAGAAGLFLGGVLPSELSFLMAGSVVKQAVKRGRVYESPKVSSYPAPAKAGDALQYGGYRPGRVVETGALMAGLGYAGASYGRELPYPDVPRTIERVQYGIAANKTEPQYAYTFNIKTPAKKPAGYPTPRYDQRSYGYPTATPELPYQYSPAKYPMDTEGTTPRYPTTPGYPARELPTTKPVVGTYPTAGYPSRVPAVTTKIPERQTQKPQQYLRMITSQPIQKQPMKYLVLPAKIDETKQYTPRKKIGPGFRVVQVYGYAARTPELKRFTIRPGYLKGTELPEKHGGKRTLEVMGYAARTPELKKLSAKEVKARMPRKQKKTVRK